MDRLRAMKTFVRVVERGSFVAAATDLGLSHGMASAIVKDLEAHLGVELIRRSTRRMALTSDGEQVLERARRILSEVETLEEDLGNRRGRVAGRLVVQAPTAFSRLVLAPSLGGFRQDHPELAVEVLSRDGFPDMVAEDIDLLVYVGRLPDSGLVVRRLARFSLVTVAAPSYIAARGAPADIDDLARHDLIDVTSATSGRRLDWLFDLAGRRRFFTAGAGLSFESAEAAVAAAIAGGGVVQNISYALSEHIAAGTLVPVLAEFRDPGPDMHLLTRRQGTVPARVRAFASHILAIARRRAERDLAILGGSGVAE